MKQDHDLAKFSGFQPEAVTFLAELAANNNRPWFKSHKQTYESVIVQPALSFAAELGKSLGRFAPSVQAEPRVGGSLFRIQRDTRFSSDKFPYKTHVGIRLRDRDTAKSSHCTGPLFYVQFDATSLTLGIGVKEFDPATLRAYRVAVTNGKRARMYAEAVKKAERKGASIVGELLKRPPRGYADEDGPLVRRKGLFLRFDQPLPSELHRAGFISYCTKRFEPYADFFSALRAASLEAMRAR